MLNNGLIMLNSPYPLQLVISCSYLIYRLVSPLVNQFDYAN